MVAIVDYNMGNLASVINAFKILGANIAVESDPLELHKYDKLILPGVGAFGDAMEHLRVNGMDKAVIAYANSGNPYWVSAWVCNYYLRAVKSLETIKD